MSTIDWPATLPDTLSLEGLSDRLPSGAIRTQMDGGPVKQRRRFTAAVEPITGSLVLTAAQTEILDAFWLTTTKMGTLSFNWTHPRKLTAVEMRFVATSPPQYTPAGGLYSVTLELEVLP